MITNFDAARRLLNLGDPYALKDQKIFDEGKYFVF